MGAAVVGVLRLPLSAVLLALVLTNGAGRGVEPLVIVGVVAAFATTLALSNRRSAENDDSTAEPTAAPESDVAVRARARPSHGPGAA
jgi:hypothetical protein